MTPVPSELFTIGYEGLDIDAFVARVCAAGVQTVVDVRELPLSRKRGFSKHSLSEALSRAGIAYLHARTLGCPKPIRDRYKRDGDWTAYTEAFLAYIARETAGTRELVKVSKVSTTCLVCFEADYSMCHRTFVARAARKLGGLQVTHLTAKTEVSDSCLRSVA